jgi:hypothetical protein
MIERRLDGCLGDATAMRRQALAQHFATRVVAKQTEECRPVDIGEPFAKGDQGSIVIGRDAQGVRERGKIPRRHEVGSAVGGREDA